MKKVSILGSTGSIGIQALEVADAINSGIEVVALSCKSNIKIFEEQIRKYKPELACIVDADKYSDLKIRVSDTPTKVVCGEEGLIDTAVIKSADVVLNSVVGIAGLVPTISAICEKKEIALANKETLVTGGEVVMSLSHEMGVNIIPVDSEHSAIFQCLKDENRDNIKNIWLTASGGPFRGKKRDDLLSITKEQALKHPNWSMGNKITIDSATLMNKGLEVIEAKWLFGVDAERILPVIHPESVIHSMVEFCDNSVLAQMGSADMRLPISYAINYPIRKVSVSKNISFYDISNLTFEKPDTDTFKALSLAYKAIKLGGLMPSVLNGANEVAVELFLNGKIGFLEIADFVEETMNAFQNDTEISVTKILEADKFARKYVYSLAKCN